MIFKCNDCGILWTTRWTTTKTNPKHASVKTCNDCADFDWPNYTKRVEYAKSLGLGKQVKKADAKSK